MCGRFVRKSAPKEIAELFRLDAPPDELTPRYNVKPGEPIAVVGLKPDGLKRGLAAIRWGLVPWWSQDGKDFYINAMAETVHQKPSFRDSFREKRCLVVADGFYEPLKSAGAKRGAKNRQWFFRLGTGEPFAFAGLWDVWQGADGKKIVSCCIVTTPPNELVGAVHDRQPVILRPDQHAAWLSHDTEEGELRSFLMARPAGEMVGWEVNREYVCDPNRDGPECLVPAA